MGMFCNQCQEADGNTACTEHGVCGKDEHLSGLQDILMALLRGVSTFAHELRQHSIPTNEADVLVMDGLFSTVTNVQFDESEIVLLIGEALEIRSILSDQLPETSDGDRDGSLNDHLRVMASWSPKFLTRSNLPIPDPVDSGGMGDAEANANAEANADTTDDTNDDVQSLRQLLTVGIKGIAAYAHHARILDFTDDEIFGFMHEVLRSTIDRDLGVPELTDLLLRETEMATRTLKLLDKANTDTYGHPEPTDVELGVRDNPGILISGHDLRDLEDLLEQTADTGIDVYTNGEMLAGHAYPAFQGYPHFAGNYGGAWWRQNKEFLKFNGPILMSTNCLTPPDPGYAHRTFTTGVAGYPGVVHIPQRINDGSKDFSQLIDMARTLPPPEPLEEGQIEIGCARETLSCSADSLLKYMLLGDIDHLVVIAGCDGRHTSREYYTNLAKNLSKGGIILTAGCAKYRLNKLDLGEAAGLPRVLDAGQCNDAYSLALVLMGLAEATGKDSINDLPISFHISWFEQKAIAVLLSLLHLGIRRIQLGPTVPAFLSPNIIRILSETFDLIPINLNEVNEINEVNEVGEENGEQRSEERDRMHDPSIPRIRTE